jgi:hypothetical protein
VKTITKTAPCDICRLLLSVPDEPAVCDIPVHSMPGAWANCCPIHEREYGQPHAEAVGYRFASAVPIVLGPEAAAIVAKAEKVRKAAIRAAIRAGDFEDAFDLIGDDDIEEYM